MRRASSEPGGTGSGAVADARRSTRPVGTEINERSGTDGQPPGSLNARTRSTLIDLAIPVLSRPHRAHIVANSAYDAATVHTRIVFVCSPGDDEQIEACHGVGFADVIVVDWMPAAGDYAKKINLAYRLTEGTHFFTGADDLTFEHGWDAACLAFGDKGVVGTSDGGNPLVVSGGHSTHSLVSRRYIDSVGGTYHDGPGIVLHDQYDHQRVDNELVHAAQVRGEWAFSPSPKVLHHHPMWDRTVPNDSTYLKAQRAGRLDQRLYGQRRRQFMVAQRSSRVASGRIVR